MYNDEENLYHYTYRKGAGEPGQTYNARGSVDEQIHHYYQQSQQPPVDAQPVQEAKPAGKKPRTWIKVAALALACALLGGLIGGGAVYGVTRGGGSGGNTAVSVSGRKAEPIAIKTVNGKDEMTDAEVYAANVNSVVSINVTGTSGYNFFGQPVQTASSGSGFVLTRDGYIVTNYHVVENAEDVQVTLYNGDTYTAKYIGGDEDYDIAVIKVEAAELQPVTLGNSDTLNVGDRVLAVGNPLGELTFSMSGGMVSSANRAINVSGTPFNMIQTDASINPGNSGGPLFNRYGEVVGIVSAKYSASSSVSGSVEGLGFAIPINDVEAMIQDIMTNGYITNKPYLGITGMTMTEQMSVQYRIDVSRGVFVCSAEEGSAAEKAGLKMGDVIVSIDGNGITSMEDITAVKKKYSAGDTSDFAIYRENQKMTVSVTWGAMPADKQSEETPQQRQQITQNPYGSYGFGFGDLFGGLFGN